MVDTLEPMASEWQALITITGIPGTFGIYSGGARNAETRSEFDGGSTESETSADRPAYEDLVVSRGFRPNRDSLIRKTLDAQVGRLRTTVTVQPTDVDMVPVGQPDVYTVLLKGVSPPPGNANSTNTARLELRFAVIALA